MNQNSLKYFKPLFLILLIVFLISSCDEYFQPKPRGYFRIFLPEKKYHPIQMNLPYYFEIPEYSTLEHDPQPMAEDYWTNLVFPSFNAKLHLSYKAVNGNLNTLLEDTHKLVNKHIPKANAISERVFINEEKEVYGLAYSIKGVDAASPYQFYLTDSTHHFLRGALYFNVRPNNDSLAPVISFLETDIQKLIESFEWRNNDF
ncbi:MAG: gliding motility lipoprotein GldD [Bacteroidales bacterium]|nr:gliding motility lipoprotein GldD [Bacteroidales bacterium]RLD38540.1 MAG: gliding motility lipoprotein GldD [Bacteroidota bacterium]